VRLKDLLAARSGAGIGEAVSEVTRGNMPQHARVLLSTVEGAAGARRWLRTVTRRCVRC
jgi:hypothetical protein